MKNEQSIDYQIERKEDKVQIKLNNQEQQKVTILMGCTIQNLEPAIEARGSEFEIYAPKSGQPYYFQIEIGDFKSETFGERFFYLDGAINVRDSGGYKVGSSKRVKWGKLLRGDQLNRLSEADIEIMTRIPIHTIVDYRSDHERLLNPNKNIPSVVRSIQCDPESVLSEAAGQASDLNDENMKLIEALGDGSIPAKYINGKGEQVKENYRNLVLRETSQKAFRSMFKIYLDTENAPLFQHCRGGKDRTGFGTALILLALGVSKADVIYDYRLTEHIRKDRNAFKMKQYRELTDNESYLEYLYSLIETRSEYLEASFETIDKHYGGIDSYLRDVMQLEDEDFKTLRDFYLEEV